MYTEFGSRKSYGARGPCVGHRKINSMGLPFFLRLVLRSRGPSAQAEFGYKNELINGHNWKGEWKKIKSLDRNRNCDLHIFCIYIQNTNIQWLQSTLHYKNIIHDYGNDNPMFIRIYCPLKVHFIKHFIELYIRGYIIKQNINTVCAIDKK